MRPLTAGIVDCVSKIYKEEGPAAFSKGLFPRMLVQAPLFGLTLLSYGTFAQVQVGLERGELLLFSCIESTVFHLSLPSLLSLLRLAEVLKVYYNQMA